MTTERHEEIRILLKKAMELSPEERTAYLNRACSTDASLRQEVETLLASSDEVRSTFLQFSSQSPRDRAATSADDPAPTLSIDAGDSPQMVIGHYHLVRRIGEGGMGEVWLAEQKEPVRRRVALKLIKTGLNSREAMARFESERQALALMDHPAIAKVFDAGATAQGAPYFVMEYVAGIPITDFCDRHELSTRERLELFSRVCEGVQHAHQKAIIHRDLKPSNILVSEVDGKAMPKIIDFGVAKAVAQKLTPDTIFTRAGVLVGTPEYMSPEQATSAGEDIDTRTDVYSLGIIFYELLAGAPPIELREVAFEEFLRRLREDDPPKPSAKVSTHNPATSTEVARKRQTQPRALARQLRGELDSIALKALEKERARRYASASELAADIERYLNSEAVLAVPPSFGYRAGKFARRYRVALITACAFVLVLTAAAAVSIRQSIRAKREAIRADREAAVAEAVNNFLQKDLLAQASANNQAGPSTKPDPDLKVRTALDRAAAKIEGKFEKQPEVEAAIRHTIGKTYEELGLNPEAQRQEERALEIRRRVLGPEHPDTLQSMNSLANVYHDRGKYAPAEALYAETLEIMRRVLGPEHPDTLKSMGNLAVLYADQGKYTQAEALDAEILEIKRRVLGPEHPDTLMSMNNLAADYRDQGEKAQAKTLDTETLEIRRRVLGPEHPNTLQSMTNLALDYREQSKYAQAEALDTEALEIRRRVLGPEHPKTLLSAGNLAAVYNDQGKYAQAEVLNAETLEIRRRVLGPEHPDTLQSMNNLAVDYARQGKYAQAETLDAQTLEIRRRVLGPEHPRTLHIEAQLAICLSYEKRYAKAEGLLHDVIEKARQSREPGVLAHAWYGFACAAAVAGRTEAALEYLQKAADLGPENIQTMADENDLKSLRNDPRFTALIAKAKEKESAAHENK